MSDPGYGYTGTFDGVTLSSIVQNDSFNMPMPEYEVISKEVRNPSGVLALETHKVFKPKTHEIELEFTDPEAKTFPGLQKLLPKVEPGNGTLKQVKNGAVQTEVTYEQVHVTGLSKNESGGGTVKLTVVPVPPK
ncbi:hypothetical protein ACFWAR_14840 [Streptomyces sp. NPDC059917]|uniref:hypothetical protein n=1 Tax=Streptomyces sp. NPDC059917 TaxID=3347002 RepID=UPI003648698A